jgi:branched-chain amino acid aminotransferase
MKAFKKNDGTPSLFRPEQHVIRLNASARRMMMPEISEEMFLEAVNAIVDLEQNWIPKAKGSALYLRPVMFAMEAKLGVKVSNSYKFIIITGPVGPYYPKPVRLLAETKYIRAAQGGVGEAKTAGNYAASLLPAQIAKEKGFDQVIWLDAKEFKYVQEVGTMNLFFVFKDKVVTPETSGNILKGITRKSIIEILKADGVTVEERPISMDEVVAAYDRGDLLEMFGSGTAAVVANVSEFSYNDKLYTLSDVATHSTANGLRDRINALRAGEIKDTFGWVVDVKSTVKV